MRYVVIVRGRLKPASDAAAEAAHQALFDKLSSKARSLGNTGHLPLRGARPGRVRCHRRLGIAGWTARRNGRSLNGRRPRLGLRRTAGRFGMARSRLGVVPVGPESGAVRAPVNCTTSPDATCSCSGLNRSGPQGGVSQRTGHSPPCRWATTAGSDQAIPLKLLPECRIPGRVWQLNAKTMPANEY